MDKLNFIRLIDAYLNGSASEADKALLEAYYEKLQAGEYRGLSLDKEDALEQLMFAQIVSGMEVIPVKRRRVKLWPRIAVAAAAVAAIVFSIWFYTSRHLEGSNATRDLLTYKNDIAPGKNTATIKIGNGEAITLSDKQTGVVVNTNQVTYNDGSTVLSSRANAKDLTISTPRGGTYQITLPDGTKVWLNAASVLTYMMPLNERGGVRKVGLSGEAYFEVFRNKKQAFVVTTKNLTTTVLGTHFNISAYDDEQSARATLLEGSIRVAPHRPSATSPRGGEGLDGGKGDGGEAIVLKPAQQATVTSSSGITVKQVDASETVAWKNGEFMFNNEPLESIMKKVARWYDVEVIYQGMDKDKSFWGGVSRYDNISKVLEKLEMTGNVHFKVIGRKVYVNK